jgi:hypothetical protein
MQYVIYFKPNSVLRYEFNRIIAAYADTWRKCNVFGKDMAHENCTHLLFVYEL